MTAHFRLFGLDHWLALGVIALAAVGLVKWGRAADDRRRLGARISLALLLLGYGVAAYCHALVIRQVGLGYVFAYLLPLHLCDMLLFTTAWALFRRGQLAFEFTYFAVLAGALPASLTPDLRSGFPSFAYIHFFWGHGALLVNLAWLIGVEGMRPLRGCVGRMALSCAVYVGAVGLLDVLFGWNYGYLLRKPSGATALDYLGPWPWYLVNALGLALPVFWLLALPWRRIPERRSAEPCDEQGSAT